MKKLSVCSGDGRASGRIVGRYVCDASSRVNFGSPFRSLAIESVEIGSAMMCKWTVQEIIQRFRVPTGLTAARYNDTFLQSLLIYASFESLDPSLVVLFDLCLRRTRNQIRPPISAAPATLPTWLSEPISNLTRICSQQYRQSDHRSASYFLAATTNLECRNHCTSGQFTAGVTDTSVYLQKEIPCKSVLFPSSSSTISAS